jgi:hypothetical protein
MNIRRATIVVLAVFAAGVFCESGWAAMQIRKKAEDEAPEAAPPPAAPAEAAPAAKPAEAPKPAAPPRAPKKKEAPGAVFSGSVILSQGKEILVDIPQGAKLKERFTVYGPRLDKRGNTVVVRDMGKGVFRLKLINGSASVGDRLARETEDEAYARIRKSASVSETKEFLEVFPNSARKERVATDLFRRLMRQSYPVYPGITVKGKVVLEEKVGQDITPARILVKLDRFVIAQTDDLSAFSIEGIPPLDYPVKVKMIAHDPKFQMAREVVIEIPAAQTAEVQKDLPVKLTPTVLVGQVTDEKGAPVREAEVWTSPYTMEVLTDEKGGYRISRRKKLDSSGTAMEGDEPLLGRDYEVYAFRRGFGAERVAVVAQSFVENPVKPIGLARQNPYEEGFPELNVDLRANLDLMQFVVPAGGGPKINQ